MNTPKTAACGIDCSECASYKVTANQDLDAAELIVDWYRERGWIGENEGAEAVLKKAPLCNGCWGDNDDSFFKCGCHMLKCCKEKQLNHCGECSDFPCEQYNEFASGHETYQKAMERLLSLREAL